MANRRTAGAALIAAAGLVLTSVVAMAGPAHAGTLSITPTPSTVHDGQTISVSGNAGSPNAPDLYVAVCEAAPTASNCDQSITGFGGPQAHILQVSPNQTTGAWGPVNFYVRQVLKTGHTPAGYDCLATPTCVIGTTNSANPADHSFDVVTALHFDPVAVPALTAGPTVTGTARVGSTLTCAASFSGATSIKYTWLRKGATIAKATSRTYKAVGSDYNRRLACTATGGNAAGWSAASTSAARTVGLGAAVKATVKPTVKGTPKVGKTLTAGRGTWAAPVSSYRYQWLRNGKKIAKATKSTYKLTTSDRGRRLQVTVTVTSYGYANGTATSASSKTVG